MERGVDEQGELPAEQQLQPLPDGDRVGVSTPDDRKFAHRDFVIHKGDLKKRQQSHGDGYTQLPRLRSSEAKYNS